MLAAGDGHEGLKTKGREGKEDSPDSSLARDLDERTGKLAEELVCGVHGTM